MRRIALVRCAGLLAFGSSIALAGSAEPPAPYSLDPERSALEVPAVPETPTSALPPEPSGVLRLADALAAALVRNPDLAADVYEVRAREAALVQAGAWPNPTVSIEVEDVAGTGAYRSTENAQTTLLLGQLIELGGKRAARVGLAAASRDVASWDYELRRVDVLARVAGAFVDVLAAQERRRLAAEGLELARSMQRVARLRSRSGVASAAEEIRANVAADVAAVELEHTEHELATARQALAATWAAERAAFDRAEGDLERLPSAPSEEALDRKLHASPSVARWQAEIAQRDAQLVRVRSERIPDVTLQAGPRRLSGPEETSLVVALSVPLPLWDGRSAAIEEAEHRTSKATAEARAAHVRSLTDLESARTRLAASAEEAAVLRSRVIPGTEQAVQVLRAGYEQGRFTQIEVLDAERERLAAREQYLGALVEAHHSAQRIERLTGVPLEVRP